MVHKQISSLETFDETENFYEQSLKLHSDNNYFIKVPLSDNAMALIFVGWPYDSTPSQLLIFVLTPTDVRMVYNKNMKINSITQMANNFSMIIQSNILDGGEGTPGLHTLWLKDGVLWFKNN